MLLFVLDIPIMGLLKLAEIWVLSLILYLNSSVYGRSSTSNRSNPLRIYRGTMARISDVPYVVYIVDFDTMKSCTGAIVGPIWVLTAAHCVENLSEKTDVIVFAGFDEMKVLKTKKHSVQSRKAQKILKHPKFDDFEIVNDFMCIMVNRPFDLNNEVEIIQISNKPWPRSDPYSVVCVAAGWGQSETDVETTYLRKATVIARHGPDGCTGGCFGKNQNKKLICLTRPGRVCPGDSGGILACGGKAVGVAHGIYIPEDCGWLTSAETAPCEETLSIYMLIWEELQWINSHIQFEQWTEDSNCVKSPTLSIALFLAAVIFLKIF